MKQICRSAVRSTMAGILSWLLLLPFPMAAQRPGGTDGRFRVGPVRVRVLPQYGYLERNRVNELNVMIKMDTPLTETTGKPKPPVDLAIVIDRSGSMGGDKIIRVRDAAAEMVDKLNNNDRVTLISYASDITIHSKRLKADGQGKAHLKSMISELAAGGSTALGPALFQALQVLEKAERGERDVAHVILLSDGRANVGESRPAVLAARAARGFTQGVSLSTMGVGLDYNEDLMTRIAEQGGGRYHFIKDSNTITRVLDNELAGLSSTVARTGVMSVEPAQGVRVEKVYGYPSNQRGRKTLIKLGSISSGQTRNIIIKLRLPRSTRPEQALGTLQVRFNDISQGGKIVTRSYRPRVRQTADRRLVRRSEKKEVAVRVAVVRSAVQLDDATRAVGRGNYSKGKRMLRRTIADLKEEEKRHPSAGLRRQIKLMEKACRDAERAKRSSRYRQEYMKSNKARSYQQQK